MANSTYVKLTIAPAEAAAIDRQVESGFGTCRADICHQALILYLDEQQRRSEAVA